MRADATAICHNHTPSILPFSISKTVRLRPVIHTAAVLGGEVPVWDIADEFGANTNMLVINMDQARSPAPTLGTGGTAQRPAPWHHHPHPRTSGVRLACPQ